MREPCRADRGEIPRRGARSPKCFGEARRTGARTALRRAIGGRWTDKVRRPDRRGRIGRDGAIDADADDAGEAAVRKLHAFNQHARAVSRRRARDRSAI